MATYRALASVTPPSASQDPVNLLVNQVFTVTQPSWLNATWWYVADSSQSTAAIELALWNITTTQAGQVIAGTTVTSGTLALGWNRIPFASPVPLAAGGVYAVVVYAPSNGTKNAVADISGFFTTGGAGASGFTNGPLEVYSSASVPDSLGQDGYNLSSTNPAATLPLNTSNSWYGIDHEVADAASAPAGATFRLWPNLPVAGPLNSTTLGYTQALNFTLTEPCAVARIWFFSASGAAILPSQTAIWNNSTQALVPGTDNTSPSWSAAAGAGWVSVAVGVTLPAGSYAAGVYSAGGGEWLAVTVNYWSGGGPGTSGLTAGPLSAPSGTAAAQNQRLTGAFGYPSEDTAGEQHWVDIEVLPVAAGKSGLLASAGII